MNHRCVAVCCITLQCVLYYSRSSSRAAVQKGGGCRCAVEAHHLINKSFPITLSIAIKVGLHHVAVCVVLQ